ncbi:hypothetical protein, partial [Microcoleus sp. T3_D1]|uniref:hypothetical protein n=1 Tax=Microcoleus sp. T3_D1 TaxID=3055427 RepID=UPI002FD576DA
MRSAFCGNETVCSSAHGGGFLCDILIRVLIECEHLARGKELRSEKSVRASCSRERIAVGKISASILLAGKNCGRKNQCEHLARGKELRS